MHQMRARIMTSPVFTGERFWRILFENTIDRDIEGEPTADYLWNMNGSCISEGGQGPGESHGVS